MSGEHEIKVTPEMVEAGSSVLQRIWSGKSGEVFSLSDKASEIYRVMETQRRAQEQRRAKEMTEFKINETVLVVLIGAGVGAILALVALLAFALFV